MKLFSSVIVLLALGFSTNTSWALHPDLRLRKKKVTTPVAVTLPLQVTFTSAGTIRWTFNGSIVATGTPVIQGLSPTSTTGVTLSDTEEKVTQVYAAAKITATYDCVVDGTDVTITAHIVNNGNVVTSPIVITYPSFKFSSIPTGTMPAWNWTYLAANGTNLYHPSVMSPLGCVFAGDSKFTVAAWSPSELPRQSLIQATFASDANLPNPLPVELHTVDTVAGGGSADISIVLRVTTDNTPDGILSGYKPLLSAMCYTPVQKPATEAASIDSSWITSTNPYGYNGDWRRIDLAQGVQSYLATEIPKVQSMGGIGTIFWAPGGFQKGPFYPIDFDVNLNRISSTWPALVAGYKSAGLRVGICARLGDALNSDGSERRADPNNPADVTTMLTRVDNVAATGANMWYVDSACADANSLAMVGIAVKHLGSNHLFYTEYTNDISLSFAGVYCEWMGTRTRWLTELQRTHLLTLFPNSSWLCIDRTGKVSPSQLSALGLQPLVGD